MIDFVREADNCTHKFTSCRECFPEKPLRQAECFGQRSWKWQIVWKIFSNLEAITVVQRDRYTMVYANSLLRASREVMSHEILGFLAKHEGKRISKINRRRYVMLTNWKGMYSLLKGSNFSFHLFCIWLYRNAQVLRCCRCNDRITLDRFVICLHLFGPNSTSRSEYIIL